MMILVEIQKNQQVQKADIFPDHTNYEKNPVKEIHHKMRIFHFVAAGSMQRNTR